MNKLLLRCPPSQVRSAANSLDFTSGSLLGRAYLEEVITIRDYEEDTSPSAAANLPGSGDFVLLFSGSEPLIMAVPHIPPVEPALRFHLNALLKKERCIFLLQISRSYLGKDTCMMEEVDPSEYSNRSSSLIPNEEVSVSETNSEAAREGPLTLRENEESMIRVMKSFSYYGTYYLLNSLRKKRQIECLPAKQRAMLDGGLSEHTRKLLECINVNQSVLDLILEKGCAAMGVAGQQAAAGVRANHDKASSPHFMSKMTSTVKQIAREWSAEGRVEREATYVPILQEMEARFPKNQYTLYPYITGTSNSLSYEDQTRPVYFPDVCPTRTLHTFRDPPMSMTSGDFLRSFEGEDGKYAAIITSWFIDTAQNPIEYIENCNRLLQKGGVWINCGPLMYHYADEEDTPSLELPYNEILRIVQLCGFRLDKQRVIESCYAGDRASMLQYKYNCGFFVAIKME